MGDGRAAGAWMVAAWRGGGPLTCGRSSGPQTPPSRCGRGCRRRSCSRCRWRPARGGSRAARTSRPRCGAGGSPSSCAACRSSGARRARARARAPAQAGSAGHWGVCEFWRGILGAQAPGHTLRVPPGAPGYHRPQALPEAARPEESLGLPPALPSQAQDFWPEPQFPHLWGWGEPSHRLVGIEVALHTWQMFMSPLVARDPGAKPR